MELQVRKIYKKDYPHLLLQTSQLPESMDISGTIPGPENKFLCVIGSRKFTAYGKEACEKLISGLKGYPIVIVSGLALGIDSMAHEAALLAELKTVAFPGSGLAPHVLYPHSRRNLAYRIVQSGGAVISPFGYNQTGMDWTFPRRNRLMAGISHATLIIEGGKGSGTLLTTGNAAEFNRDVLAVPGSIFDELSYGPHMLIRDGATAVTSSTDILRALDFTVTPDGQQSFLNLAELSLSPEEKRIIAELQFSPLSGSDLVEKTALPTSMFNVLISQLELAGVVREENGVYRMKQ